MLNLIKLINNPDLQSPKSVIVNNWSASVPYHTSIDIATDKVYNIHDGVVVDICKEGNYLIVTVQVDYQTILRYGHLSSVSVNAGAAIEEGMEIGEASKFVSFEYCTADSRSQKFPVYIGTLKFYKYDPSKVLIDDINFNNSFTSYMQLSYQNHLAGV